MLENSNSSSRELATTAVAVRVEAHPEREWETAFKEWGDPPDAGGMELFNQPTKRGFRAGWRAADKAIAFWMIERGYATGHGDTLGDMLGELVWQVREQAPEVAALLSDGSPTATKTGPSTTPYEPKAGPK